MSVENFDITKFLAFSVGYAKLLSLLAVWFLGYVVVLECKKINVDFKVKMEFSPILKTCPECRHHS